MINLYHLKVGTVAYLFQICQSLRRLKIYEELDMSSAFFALLKLTTYITRFTAFIESGQILIRRTCRIVKCTKPITLFLAVFVHSDLLIDQKVTII